MDYYEKITAEIISEIDYSIQRIEELRKDSLTARLIDIPLEQQNLKNLKYKFKAIVAKAEAWDMMMEYLDSEIKGLQQLTEKKIEWDKNREIQNIMTDLLNKTKNKNHKTE